jgi:hypothetical protein
MDEILKITEKYDATFIKEGLASRSVPTQPAAAGSPASLYKTQGVA